MWHIRAKFDIALKAVKPPPQNVFLTCNYCGKNICPAADEKDKDNEKETKVLRIKDQSENGSNNFKVCMKENGRSLNICIALIIVVISRNLFTIFKSLY